MLNDSYHTRFRIFSSIFISFLFYISFSFFFSNSAFSLFYIPEYFFSGTTLRFVSDSSSDLISNTAYPFQTYNAYSFNGCHYDIPSIFSFLVCIISSCLFYLYSFSFYHLSNLFSLFGSLFYSLFYFFKNYFFRIIYKYVFRCLFLLVFIDLFIYVAFTVFILCVTSFFLPISIIKKYIESYNEKSI